MNKKALRTFLIKARAKTYAGGGGKVKSVLPGSVQMEYTEKEWVYRDIYNIGNGIFMGLETVYVKGKPVWSNSYFGNFSAMTEEEIDHILREALITYKDKARLWYNISWEHDGYRYLCQSDGHGTDLTEVGGSEEIYKGKKRVYYFFYAGGLIG